MVRQAENFVEIVGNLVSFGSRTINRQVHLSDLMEHLVIEKPTMLPSIARSQVFSYWDPTNPTEKVQYMLCELPPSTRSITKQSGGIVKRYKLAMPWTYFWFVARTFEGESSRRWQFDMYRVFHARERYKNIDSPFITAMIPNVYANGVICFGSTGAPSVQPVGDRADQLVAEWYNSNFNTDVDSATHYPWYTENFRRWVEESRNNPRCWETWPEWTDGYPKYSVRKLLEEIQQMTQHEGRSTQFDFVAEMVDSGQVIPRPENLPYTYGHWEEFILAEIPPEQRRYAMTAFENILATTPQEIPTVEPPEISDDGGVVVNEPAR